MANVTFNKKTFESEIGKLDDNMQEKIALFGTPLESIGSDEIEIEIFPNRPDLLSYQGFKRSFLAFLGKKTGIKKYNIHKPEKNFIVKIDSSVKKIRPYTACAIVKNIKLNDERIKELIEIQEKLHSTLGRKRKKLAIGIYPLEKITLPITYKAVEPDKIKFHPLESSKEMSGLEILQKHDAGKEYAHLLAGKVKFPIFIDADKNILSMPPIINSELTGRISEKTKDVFIECSGHDFDLLKKSLNMIVTTLAEMNGKIYQMELKYSKKEITPDLTTSKKKISIEKTNKLLGTDIKESELKSLIEKMGHNFSKGSVEIPSWRTDILHEVDLIEEVAIAYGYNNFKPVIPKISTIGSEDIKEILKRKITDIIVGLDFTEVSNYHLTTKGNQLEKMGISPKQTKGIIEVEESKTDYTILRSDLSHYLLKNLGENVDGEYPQKIVELGSVFAHNKEEISEKENLAFAITPGNFTDVKQSVQYLFKMLNQNIHFEEATQKDIFIEGRNAHLIAKGKVIGTIGEVHPKILKNWKIKMPVALCEINLEEVLDNIE